MESVRTDKQLSDDRMSYDHSDRYRLLSDASFEGLVIHERGKIIDANRTFAESLGYDRSEIIGRMATDFAAPEYHDIIMQHILSDSQKPYDAELMRKDGTRFLVEIIGRAVNYQGKKLRVVAIRDVAERKRAEEAKREVEALTKGLIASSYDIAILFHVDGTILELNEAAARSLGQSRKQLLGTNGFDLMPPEVIKHRKEWITKSINTKQPCRFEDNRDGRWFDNCFYPVFDGQGQAITIAVVARDITDKKTAELALRESEEKWRSLVENAPDAITLVDRNGTVLYINRPPTVLTEKDCVGKRYLDLAPPEYREMVQEQIDKVIETGRPTSFVIKYQSDDGAIWFRNRAGSVKCDGTVTAVMIISSNITEQVRTEEALREREETYRQLVEISPDAVTASDLDGHITFVSRHCLALFKIPTPDDALGRLVFEFISPEDHERAAHNMRRIISEGALRNIEYSLVRADGSRFLGEVNATIVRDDQGIPMTFITTIRDITERKVMENQLRESEEKFRNLAEQSPNMIFISMDGRFRYVNTKVEETLGYTKEELYDPGFDILTALAPKSVNLAKENRERHSKGEDVLPSEYTALTRDGRKIELILTTRLIAYEDETAILGVATDITGRKQMERLLQESESRFREIASKIPGVVFQFIVKEDGAFAIPFISDGVTGITGMTPRDVQENPKRALSFLVPEDLAVIMKRLQEKSDTVTDSAVEVRVNRSDGDIRWLRVASSGRALPSGGILRNGVAFDITDQKRAEEQIIHYSEQLEAEVEKRTAQIKELDRQRAEHEKLAATGRMAARIAHEINNPLAGIKNSFRLIKEAVPDNHKYSEYVTRIDKEIDRIAQIVHRVFDLYRPYQNTPQEFSVNECIKDVVALLKASLNDNNLTIALDMPEKPIIASVPSGYLTQVLFNIIQNGIESMPGKGEVTVKLKGDDSYIVIEVVDQGSGIPDEIRDQIFEPFFTTKSNPASGGLGLGLSVSKGMVEAMGGSLGFSSIKNQGTTFCISLPAEDKK
jgi:PAS domain S-box-containing protein